MLVYDESHIEDEYGGLSEKPLDFPDFDDFEIRAQEFEQVSGRLDLR